MIAERHLLSIVSLGLLKLAQTAFICRLVTRATNLGCEHVMRQAAFHAALSIARY